MEQTHAAGPATGDEARLITGKLPGELRPYALRDGEGEYHLVGGQVATLIARAADTGGLSEAAVLTGGKGALMPLHRHAGAHEALLVLDGQLELWLDGHAHLLSRGDYASVPAGTAHGHRMLSHRTRLLSVTMGGRVGATYPAIGASFARPVQPEAVDDAIDSALLDEAEAVADVRFDRTAPAFGAPERVTAAELPASEVPYVLMSGEGERLVAAEQMFTLTGTRKTSGGRFITVMNEGPAGQAIPEHYHAEHTENFFCLDGLMTMWLNGQEIRLHPGDFLHVPARHVHSYRLDAPYTRFFGWLTPGVFEPFFRLIGDPYAPHVFPVQPPPFRFDRVLAHIAELDLHPVRR